MTVAPDFNLVVKNRAGTLLVTATTVFFSLLVSLAVSANLDLLGVVTAAIPIIVWVNIILTREANRHLWDWVFWIGLGLIIVVPMIIKLTGRNFSFLFELLLLAIAPALIHTFLGCMKASSRFRWAMFYLAVFLVIAIASTVFGRSQWIAAIYQAGSNLKYMLMILLGASMRWTPKTETWFWRFVRWFWLIQVVLLAWQWIHPGSYFSVFWGAEYRAIDPLGLLPGRGLGTFQHPSVLGGVAAALFVISWLRYLTDKRPTNFMVAAMYLLVLLASTERQELSAAVIVAAAFWLRQARLTNVLVFGSLVLPAVLAAIVLAWPKVAEKSLIEAEQWGIVGNHRIDHPRAVTYLTAATIANDHFPLGSGLGTFGGAGAKRFDDSYYWQLGFSRYWWFNKEDFLMDTYWPNIYAEAGWLGLVAMILSLAIMLGIPAQEAKRPFNDLSGLHSQLAVAVFAYTIIVSLTSPSIQDPVLFLIPAVLFGLAMRSRTDSTAIDYDQVPTKPRIGGGH